MQWLYFVQHELQEACQMSYVKCSTNLATTIKISQKNTENHWLPIFVCPLQLYPLIDAKKLLTTNPESSHTLIKNHLWITFHSFLTSKSRNLGICNGYQNRTLKQLPLFSPHTQNTKMIALFSLLNYISHTTAENEKLVVHHFKKQFHSFLLK